MIGMSTVGRPRDHVANRESFKANGTLQLILVSVVLERLVLQIGSFEIHAFTVGCDLRRVGTSQTRRFVVSVFWSWPHNRCSSWTVGVGTRTHAATNQGLFNLEKACLDLFLGQVFVATTPPSAALSWWLGDPFARQNAVNGHNHEDQQQDPGNRQADGELVRHDGRHGMKGRRGSIVGRHGAFRVVRYAQFCVAEQ